MTSKLSPPIASSRLLYPSIRLAMFRLPTVRAEGGVPVFGCVRVEWFSNRMSWSQVFMACWVWGQVWVFKVLVVPVGSVLTVHKNHVVAHKHVQPTF